MSLLRRFRIVASPLPMLALFLLLAARDRPAPTSAPGHDAASPDTRALVVFAAASL